MEEHAAFTLGEIALRLGLALLLVAGNAFFVASEFALVGARRARIDEAARTGNRRARLAQSAIQRLDHYISATQLGITLASLGLGWVGESTLAVVLIDIFGGLAAPWDVLATHAVAGTIAFAFITFLHIVLGELAPKSMALQYPESVSMWTAGPLMAFSKVFTPFIWVLNGAANMLLRGIGLRSPTEAERVHRPQEIEILVAQMYEHGTLAEEPVDMIRGVFDLSETSAGEVMTPRTDIIALPSNTSLAEAAAIILEEGHSRIPVYAESLDQIIGIVLARDVWRAQQDRRSHDISELVRPVPFVPDSKSVEDLLREMQSQRVHLAVVVDEFGGTAGIVTLEDLVEEIVGEIQDEHEEDRPEIEEVEPGLALLDGTIPIWQLNEHFDIALPEEEYTTVAGYIMGRLGRIAEPGDEVEFSAGTFRVEAMDGRRIERLALRLEQPDEPDAGTGTDRADG